MKEKIEIPLSKNKLFLMIGGSILFLIIGIWLFINADNFQDHSFKLLRNPLIVKIIGILGILFASATGFFGFKKLFNKEVGLTIDANGIIDNSNATSVGLIKWDDITSIEIKQIMSTKFLLINVTNPEKYIGKAKSKMKAKLMSSNMKLYGTPISITSNTLKYNFKELEQLIQKEFQQNGSPTG